jgi:hypothetical protein
MNPIRVTILLSLAAALLITGCRMPCHEAAFATAFDSQRVAQLAHDSFKLAWDARLSAQTDLRFASSHPTHLDWSMLRYLQRISTQAPWIATEIEKHPEAPRCASKFSYDTVATDAAVLKAAYRPDLFRPGTNQKIEQLLANLDELSQYYR